MISIIAIAVTATLYYTCFERSTKFRAAKFPNGISNFHDNDILERGLMGQLDKTIHKFWKVINYFNIPIRTSFNIKCNFGYHLAYDCPKNINGNDDEFTQ